MAYLRELFDSLDVGVLVADNRAILLDANQKACELVGRSRSELVGHHISELSEQGHKHEVDLQWRAFLRDLEQSGLFSVRMPNGKSRIIHFHARANFVPGLHCSFIHAAPIDHQSTRSDGEVLRICAWTKRVFWRGEWITMEDYLRAAHKVNVSHGISPEAFANLLKD